MAGTSFFLILNWLIFPANESCMFDVDVPAMDSLEGFPWNWMDDQKINIYRTLWLFNSSPWEMVHL